MTRRKSGKCFLTSSAITLSSYSTLSLESIICKRLKNCPAICAFSLFFNENSTTAQRLCRGSMIRFLKLHVKIKEQFPANSSIALRKAGCVELGFK